MLFKSRSMRMLTDKCQATPFVFTYYDEQVWKNGNHTVEFSGGFSWQLHSAMCARIAR